MITSATTRFREQVEEFLRATGTKPSEFGRLAVGDPTFVTGLRRGRSPRLVTVDKVLAFIAESQPGPRHPRNDKVV